MNSTERQERILEILYERSQTTEKYLCEVFGKHRTTIRRDIDVLSKKYNIITTAGRYGGVKFIGKKPTKHLFPEEIALINRTIAKSDEIEGEIFKQLLNRLA